MQNLKPCKFYFGDDPTFDGFTDDSTWNGWDNIYVTEPVHKEVCKVIDPDNESGLHDIIPDTDGLYSYANGYCTSIDEDDWHIRNR